MSKAQEPVHGVARAGYLIGPLLILLPLVDAVPVLFSPNFSDLRWRFGATGILSGALMTPLFGLFVVMSAAAVLGHRRLQRALAWLCLPLAVVLVAAGVIFALDAIEVHHIAPRPAQRDLALASLKAMAKISFGAVVAAGIGVVVLRATRVARKLPAIEESMLIGTSGGR